MKKLLAILIMGLMISLPLSVFAAGSVAQKVDTFDRSDMVVLTFTWVGDSGNGTVPEETTNTENTAKIAGAYICEVRTYPGITSPTDQYDIALEDMGGFDVMGGALVNRSDTNSERVVAVMITGVYGGPAVSGPITLVITGQSVVSATGTVKVFLSRSE